jgi:NAD(P)H-flavin reductase
LVKVYKPNEIYLNGGKVSQYLDQIKIGETIDIKFPYGKVCYFGGGEFLIK